MATSVLVIFSIALLIRLLSLFKSISNEKKLKKSGAVEYGKTNSLILALLHTLFYLGAIIEASYRQAQLNCYTIAGAVVFIFSMVILLLVISHLNGIWTVKLIISKEHQVNKSFIFKFFRHPNYFLNIIPELIAIALICQAWYTLFFGLPVYFISLGIRIMQEEKVMKAHFNNY